MDAKTLNRSHTTAIVRKKLSAPIQWLLKNNLIDKTKTILDYGCGRGYDVLFLKEQGYDIYGYDPYYFNNETNNYFDIILLTYVLNVVEEQEEKNILQKLEQLKSNNGRYFVTVRRDLKENKIQYKGYIQRMSYPNLYSIYKNSNFEIYSNKQ